MSSWRCFPFVESAPRAYRLKASNAASSQFNIDRDNSPIVTPEGFPLAYEVLPGNTADCTTLSDFLHKIEEQYGRAERIWVMDRGIPTEEILSQMRRADPPIYYLVGTPKGRLSKLEKALL